MIRRKICLHVLSGYPAISFPTIFFFCLIRNLCFHFQSGDTLIKHTAEGRNLAFSYFLVCELTQYCSETGVLEQ